MNGAAYEDGSVIKLGGSLLQLPDWPARFRAWMEWEQLDRWLMVVGGGESVEGLRALASVLPLDEEQMHWRAVRMLDATWEIARELLPEVEPLVFETMDWLGELQSRRAKWLLASIASYYRPQLYEQEWGYPLPPRNWNTTSDSIAALLARQIRAKELVLLKSCPIPADLDLAKARELQIVDAALDQSLLGNCRLRLVSLLEFEPNKRMEGIQPYR